MTPETYIDTLLKKYKKTPSFPFEDWVENPISFGALINIWDEIFKNAAGKLSDNYIAFGDAKQDDDSFIYRVKHRERNIVLRITPTWPALETKIGGDFAVLETIYPPEMQPRDDKYELGITSDLDRDRLVCLFLVIQHFTHNLPENSNDTDKLDVVMVEKFGQHFGYPH